MAEVTPVNGEQRDRRKKPAGPMDVGARSSATARAETPSAHEATRNPTKHVALAFAVLLVTLVAWYSTADRWTPYSSSASMAAYVAQIAPRVSAPVVEVLALDNSSVRAGQPLARMDRGTYELAVEQAEAALAQATQQTGASAAGVSAAQAQVSRARADLNNVRAATARTLELVERGIYAAARADQSRSELAQAEAGLQAAEAELEQARQALGPTGANNPQVLSATAALEQAQLNLLYTTMTAPSDGFITNLSLTEGQYATAGQPLMTFIDPQSYWVVADFRENQLANLDPGDPVEILFDVAPGRIYKGNVECIAWGIATGRTSVDGLPQPATDTRWFEPARRIPVRIRLDPGQEQELPRKLRVGSQAEVVVFADGETGILAWIAEGLMRLSSVVSYLY